ncbi:Trypsin-like peptidase domain-containing protein [Streptomyces sp. WMMB 714]|nr:Trypsin-like peptidase domain-containing protein [Streptomyces sp. WMMB 714]
MWNRAASVEYAGRVGVGCVVAPGVILTARRMVEPASTESVGEPRIVRVLSTGGPGPRAEAEVAWRRGEAALLRCRPRDLGQEFTPVRWGEMTCTDPVAPPQCSALGLAPNGMRSIESGARRDEQAGWPDAGGPEPLKAPVHVDMDTVANASPAYGLHLALRPSQHLDSQAYSPWQGMSGAAVFCADLLMGMVAHAPGAGLHSRVEAVPARQLLEDRGFCDIIEEACGSRPRLEAADLDGLFDSLPQPAAAASYLLDPRSEVVDFIGLDTEINTLTDWCHTREGVSVAAVEGPAGVGKSRLGAELARRLSERRPEAEHQPGSADIPWTAGFLSGTPAQQPPPYGMFRQLTRPALIIVDEAETRLKQVDELLSVLAAHERPQHRIRVLLLTRSTRSWWHKLQDHYRGLVLDPPVRLGSDALYRHHTAAQIQELAEIDFSKRILTLHRAGTPDDWDAYQAADQRASAAAHTPPAQTATVTKSAPPHILTLHMDALTSVLLNSPGELTDSLPATLTLLEHETTYLKRGAAKQGLPHAHPHLLQALIALQAMAGAGTEEETTALIQTAWQFHHRPHPAPLDEHTLHKLHRTLRECHPPLDGGSCGGTGPHALTSALIERLEKDTGTFLHHALTSSHITAGQRQRSLTAIAHALTTHTGLAPHVAHTIAVNSGLLAVPATHIAEHLPENTREKWLKTLHAAAAQRQREVQERQREAEARRQAEAQQRAAREAAAARVRTIVATPGEPLVLSRTAVRADGTVRPSAPAPAAAVNGGGQGQSAVRERVVSNGTPGRPSAPAQPAPTPQGTTGPPPAPSGQAPRRRRRRSLRDPSIPALFVMITVPLAILVTVVWATLQRT